LLIGSGKKKARRGGGTIISQRGRPMGKFLGGGAPQTTKGPGERRKLP